MQKVPCYASEHLIISAHLQERADAWTTHLHNLWITDTPDGHKTQPRPSSRNLPLCECVNTCVKTEQKALAHSDKEDAPDSIKSSYIWKPLAFNYLVTLWVQKHTGSSSLHRSVSGIMAVPSACWPHVVFPGLSGNKGRKTPFYSITPAAPATEQTQRNLASLKPSEPETKQTS